MASICSLSCLLVNRLMIGTRIKPRIMAKEPLWIEDLKNTSSKNETPKEKPTRLLTSCTTPIETPRAKLTYTEALLTFFMYNR